MIDQCGRSIDYLRISVTDRCNFRCLYCMPKEGVQHFSHADILTYEEIERLVRLFAQLGIHHLRITGGEPMARKGCLDLIDTLHQIPGIESIAMTTNGSLLAGQIDRAAAAGLKSINISLDTLNPTLYEQITYTDYLQECLQTIDEAIHAGLSVKLNVVPVAGLNESGLTDLALLAKEKPICVRFIELMPVGCGAGLTPIPSDQLVERFHRELGTMAIDSTKHGFGPAQYYKPDGFIGSIGFISAVSHEFCDQCNRVRLTADGFLKLCLNHASGIDLRSFLRSNTDDETLLRTIRAAIERKPSRHGFRENIADREMRRMNEIGG